MQDATPQQVFDKLDVQKDGFVYADELLANKDAFTPALTEDEALTAVEMVDTNKDNQLEYDEVEGAVLGTTTTTTITTTLPTTTTLASRVWQPAREAMTAVTYSNRLAQTHGNLEDGFNSMEKDGDQCLSEEEFTAGATALTDPLTEEEAQYAFAGLDVDGDLLSCKAEFLGVLQLGHFYASEDDLKAAGLDIDAPPKKGSGSGASASASGASIDELVVSTVAPPVMESSQPSTTQDLIKKEEEAYEMENKPIDLTDFEKRMGKELPEQLGPLAAKEGGCVDLHAFRTAAKSFNPPLSHKEADYAFCGMDNNHDRKVCSFEFFGTLKIGHFFPSRSHLEHLREVGALQGLPGQPDVVAGPPVEMPKVAAATTKAPATTSTAAPTEEVPAVDLQPYQGLPAIVHGQAQVTLRVSSDSSGPTQEEQTQIGEAFKEALQRDLKLDVYIADVANMHLDGVGHARDQTSMILYTGGNVKDGGASQAALRENAHDIVQHIEQSIKQNNFYWLEKVQIWSEVTFSYYGRFASRLPDGTKLTEEVGTKVAGAVRT